MDSDAFKFLTHETEQKEYQAAVEGLGLIGKPKAIPGLKLRYLKDSKKKMGIALWDVLAPQLDGYVYSSDSHIPTLSLVGLKEKGVIR